MANDTAILNNVLLGSVVFKFIAMTTGVLGNVTVIIYTIFLNKEKTATSYLVGNLALADLLVCLTFYPAWIIEFIQTMLSYDSDQKLFCKFSRSTMWAFMFASTATLLAVTVDRYLYIVKPLKYPQTVTLRRAFLAVSGIWFVSCCILIVQYIYRKSHGTHFRSLCDVSETINDMEAFSGYLLLTFIFVLNFHILCIARKQRKRILAETATIASVDNFPEVSANRMSFVLGFFVAFKTAKTFAIVVAVLTICVLIPTAVGQILDKFCTDRCRQIWYVVFNYELYVINSVVNAYIYGMRHVKYRKAYLNILFKLFSCHKATN